MVRARSSVSGPGALSRRTDLTPASQPQRVASGGDFGERKAMQAQQSAAPMQSDEGPAPPGLVEGAFAATQRPNEPLTAGSPEGPGRTPRAGATPLERDPDLLLRAMYRRYPHPDLERLLLRRRRTL